MPSRPLALVPAFLALAALLAAVLAAPVVSAQQASVSAPAEVEVGSEITVSWTGPGDARDFISLDPAGAPDRQYGHYVYASKGSPITLQVPGKPGDYQVRYHGGESGYPVLASAPVKVIAATATLEVPASVAAGAPVSVTWSGPDNPRDFISIDPEAAAESAYGVYAYTTKGSPLVLAAPTAPGRYQVRYHLGVSGYAVIGAAPLTVGEVSATLEAPPRAAAGSTSPGLQAIETPTMSACTGFSPVVSVSKANAGCAFRCLANSASLSGVSMR
jgi:Ca-activated chloride channel family protein